MREKIAVALFKLDYPKDDWERLDAGRGSYNQDRYRAEADAVLDALMEPTEGMVFAGHDPLETSVGMINGEFYFDAEGPHHTFHAMIRAAKEGK